MKNAFKTLMKIAGYGILILLLLMQFIGFIFAPSNDPIKVLISAAIIIVLGGVLIKKWKNRSSKESNQLNDDLK